MSIEDAKTAIEADLAALGTALDAIDTALAALDPPDSTPGGEPDWDRGPGLHRRTLHDCRETLERTRKWRDEAVRAITRIAGE